MTMQPATRAATGGKPRTGRPRRAGSGLGGLQPFELGAQLFFRFAPGRIEGNAADRTYLLALGLIEEAHASRALGRVDLVKLGAHVGRVARGLGREHVAIDTVVRNY